ncbi:MAG: OsmC family protein [Calditrichia bacterium]|nr:OsmC family protein [Calditrichia bacterium]
MQAKVINIKGVTFIGKAKSNHWIPMDGPEDFQGSDAATRPKELILISLAGCSGSDVASILSKMREKITRFEIDVDAESANEHPKVFTKIHLTYKFWGTDLKETNLEKAINLSQDKYCSVTAMLKSTVEIKHSYEINPE